MILCNTAALAYETSSSLKSFTEHVSVKTGDLCIVWMRMWTVPEQILCNLSQVSSDSHPTSRAHWRYLTAPDLKWVWHTKSHRGNNESWHTRTCTTGHGNCSYQQTTLPWCIQTTENCCEQHNDFKESIQTNEKFRERTRTRWICVKTVQLLKSTIVINLMVKTGTHTLQPWHLLPAPTSAQTEKSSLVCSSAGPVSTLIYHHCAWANRSFLMATRLNDHQRAHRLTGLKKHFRKKELSVKQEHAL